MRTLSARHVAAMLRRYPTHTLRACARFTECTRYARAVRRCAKLELARRGEWGAR